MSRSWREEREEELMYLYLINYIINFKNIKVEDFARLSACMCLCVHRVFNRGRRVRPKEVITWKELYLTLLKAEDYESKWWLPLEVWDIKKKIIPVVSIITSLRCLSPDISLWLAKEVCCCDSSLRWEKDPGLCSTSPSHHKRQARQGQRRRCDMRAEKMIYFLEGSMRQGPWRMLNGQRTA